MIVVSFQCLLSVLYLDDSFFDHLLFPVYYFYNFLETESPFLPVYDKKEEGVVECYDFGF